MDQGYGVDEGFQEDIRLDRSDEGLRREQEDLVGGSVCQELSFQILRADKGNLHEIHGQETGHRMVEGRGEDRGEDGGEDGGEDFQVQPEC